MSDFKLRLRRLTGIACVNLRGNAHNVDFSGAVANATGLALPLTPNTVVSGDCDIFWLGPDEWLLVGGQAETSRISQSLEKELLGRHASLNDLSGGLSSFRLDGKGARQLLSKGCTLDLHPSVFSIGACAQTGLAKASVLLRPLAGECDFQLLVRRSFADYLWQWLLRAGRDYRIEVT